MIGTPSRLGVVGAGQMGQGIAQVAAQAGLDVIIVDAAPDFAVGKTRLHRVLEKQSAVVFFFPKAFTPG